MSVSNASGNDPRLGLIMALADDELILGHRHSEWTGWAPHLEEDLAFSSIAQDEMAHARLLYRLAREAGLTDRDEDALALGRQPSEYTNAVLCERPNGEWAYTLARQYLYDTADAVRLDSLASSSWQELADRVGAGAALKARPQSDRRGPGQLDHVRRPRRRRHVRVQQPEPGRPEQRVRPEGRRVGGARDRRGHRAVRTPGGRGTARGRRGDGALE